METFTHALVTHALERTFAETLALQLPATVQNLKAGFPRTNGSTLSG